MTQRTERRLDVGGHYLRLVEQGTGSPVVVLEAGSGMSADDWQDVQNRIGELTRVVAYDRAGYGRSDPGPLPRSGEQVVAEVTALLDATGIVGPLVLVGASLGGLYARLFAATHPDRVVGVVLVDARHEDFNWGTKTISDKRLAKSERLLDRALVVTRLPFLSRTCRIIDQVAGQRLPVRVRGAVTTLGHPRQILAVRDEGRVVKTTEDQVRARLSLGDIPLVVITHGRPLEAGVGLTEEDAVVAEDAWQRTQRATLHVSTRSRLVVAENAGHLIQFDAPELIVEAVEGLVRSARGDSSSAR
jgi:pimeloyl-ACP methyl ester carboxylesterase